MKYLTVLFSIVLYSTLSVIQSDAAVKALSVLETKCNVCHIKKNKRKIFTPYNMGRLAPKIHQQVFVKKRMPKGKNNKLSKEELIILKNWLNEILPANH